MKRITKILLTLFGTLFFIYLLLPKPTFPEPPLDALQSNEPADTETSLRRAYFTNYTREEVMIHYKDQFEKPVIFGISLPSYRLNYPPEEAQTIIRNQTRSTFLEEIVHPFRESVYINGFKPALQKDAIFIDGKDWYQKITVRFVPSNSFARVVVVGLALALVVIVAKEWKIAVRGFLKREKK
jgi:hypothetical protein